MKIISFIILLLALCLATLSSFSLGTKTYYSLNNWETFGVFPNTMNGDPYPNSASEIFSARICDGFWGQSSSYIEAILKNMIDVNLYISYYNRTHFPKSVICSSDFEHICVATIAYYNTIPNEATLIDYKYGDYILFQ